MTGIKGSFVALILAVSAIWLIAPSQAQAQDFDAQVRALTTGGYSAKARAVTALAATADPRAIPVLEALLEKKLYTRNSDGAVVIAEEKGSVLLLRRAVDLTEIGEASTSDLKSVRVNNRMRRAIRGALGALTLLSTDPAKRRSAAEAVFKAKDAAMVPILDRAIARETDAKIKTIMQKALASTQLTTSKDTEVRVAAVAKLAEFVEQDVQSVIGSILVKNGDGSFVETDVKVRAAASVALERMESTLASYRMIGDLFRGISLGSVLLLAAVGLAITFGVMGVINMAHGEMLMLGAYTTFVIQNLFKSYMPSAFDYSLTVAVPMAFLVAGAVGVAMERGIIRHLYGRPLETLLATWGISLILRQFVRSIFGPTNREVGNPEWMSGGIELVGGVVLTYNRIWIIVFSLLVLGALVLVLRYTAFGLQMRARLLFCRMASTMGIRTNWVDALTFGLGSGIAGMAGVALSQVDNVGPNLGQAYIVDSFMVVVFGGVGNLWGTLVGAFSLGIINKFLEPFAGAVLGKILVLIVIILFIQKRPRGLFALKGRAVEN
ncbi:MAG: urea ABC transporter permease subunit UrtB [Proteobacteria bacterium]|nr:urea ABC transporter permease subunit UrtB [Pseudomonadota bacterium]